MQVRIARGEPRARMTNGDATKHIKRAFFACTTISTVDSARCCRFANQENAGMNFINGAPDKNYLEGKIL